MISHRERIEACLSNQILDRPPVALWRHFPVDDQTAAGLANAHLSFQKNFDFDIIKYMPPSSYCLQDWGARDEWRGDFDGVRIYTNRVIRRPEDWARLPVLDPRKGRLGELLESLKIIVGELGPATPVIHTIFNPLSQAKNLVGDESLLIHLRRHPEALHAGLQTITESTRRYIEELSRIGVAGIFFAVQHAQYSLLSEEEYKAFGRLYDLQTLEPAAPFWIKLLHLHGLDVMFDLISEYPVNILNWHDRDTYPSLSEGQTKFPGVVCGGTSLDTLAYKTSEDVRKEALESIEATGGRRFLLGTGCVLPIITPAGNIMAVRQSVERGA